jgi:ABC-type bacteriocin/lantibiotic exporter with double-glycine peptidase domain
MNPNTVAAPQTRIGSAHSDELTSKLRFESVSHAFGTLDVLAGLDLMVEEGETVGLVGASGCNK